jgi:hypothetical protein
MAIFDKELFKVRAQDNEETEGETGGDDEIDADDDGDGDDENLE